MGELILVLSMTDLLAITYKEKYMLQLLLNRREKFKRHDQSNLIDNQL
jgi:hypothetical protein